MRRILALFALLIFAGNSFAASADGGPAPNDNRASSIEIPAIPAVSGYQGFATIEPGEDTSCLGTESSVWYDYRAPDATPLAAFMTDDECTHFCGGGGGPVAVYQKIRSAYAPVGCGTSVTFTPEPKGHYFFQVGGASQFRLNAAPAAKPFPDNFADRMNLVIPPFHYGEINRAVLQASLEPGEPAACGHPLTSLWYTFKGDATRLVDVHLDNNAPAYIQVYVKTVDGTLQPVPGTCRNLGEFGFSDFALSVVPGEQYYIQLGSTEDAAGWWNAALLFTVCEQFIVGQACLGST
jgi:hypothetical protein